MCESELRQRVQVLSGIFNTLDEPRLPLSLDLQHKICIMHLPMLITTCWHQASLSSYLVQKLLLCLQNNDESYYIVCLLPLQQPQPIIHDNCYGQHTAVFEHPIV